MAENEEIFNDYTIACSLNGLKKLNVKFPEVREILQIIFHNLEKRESECSYWTVRNALKSMKGMDNEYIEVSGLRDLLLEKGLNRKDL
jgi:hypothetical protein